MASISIGNKTIQSAFFGNVPIQSIYYGNVLVWSAEGLILQDSDGYDLYDSDDNQLVVME